MTDDDRAASPSHVAEARDEWSRLSGLQALPLEAAILKETSASHVYRLLGAGPRGESIIAKKRRTRDVLVERTVYSTLRPKMPFAFPREFGVSEKGDFT